MAQLTKCEGHIVYLRVYEGKARKEIAADLGLSLRTVEKHITNIYKKLGVHNLVMLCHVARAQKRKGTEACLLIY